MEIQKPRDLLRNQFLNDFVVGLGELFKAAAAEGVRLLSSRLSRSVVFSASFITVVNGNYPKSQ